MGCRLAIIGSIALFGLVACNGSAPIDPVDQARAALQAQHGSDFELRTTAIEQASGHIVVCGVGGLPSAPGGPWNPDISFTFVDGAASEGDLPPALAPIVKACQDKLPKGAPSPPPVVD